MNPTSKLTTLVATAMLGITAGLIAQTTPAPQPNICNRACWVARNGTCTSTVTLTRAIIHHTAAASEWNTTSLSDSKARLRSAQNYDMDTQGHCDMKYHFRIDKLGNIFEGRKNSISGFPKGAHAGCGNTGTFGFTFMGYFHTPYNHTPPTAMQNAMYDLLAWKMPSGWSPYGGRTSYSGSLNGTAAPLDTHSWVGATGCSGTSCPGSVLINNYITGDFFGGPMRTAVAQRRSSSVNDASFVSKSHPTSVVAGSTFSASITMKNNGTKKWHDITDHKLGSQNPQDNTRWGLSRIAVAGTVDLNQNHTFTFTCTAPTTPASYAFDWQMLEEGVQWFGGTAVATISVTAPPSAVIVDNNTSGFSASSSWIAATSSSDKYGADYRYRSTQAVSDNATWTGNLPSSKTWNVSAWWPQGANRSTTAAYHVVHSGGTTVVTVNQQANGGKWNSLGSWAMGSGNNQVRLSCWTTTGFIVVADAIRWQ
ncbi:MAG: N-acetylmuramoyl-L-alanine amidase [Verrucomicrobia bacterium]|nr:N-acetylmuramoyl-L-alanine amidase [Verrucomicrobiota bacterium]